MNTQELLDQVMTALREYVARANASRDTRLAAVEMRTGALSMSLGRGANGEKIKELEDLLRRVKALEGIEARIRALEARPTLRYVGVWREGIGHEAGSVCTHDGSMWHAQRTTTARPGASPADWVLCAKGGKGIPR